MLNIGTFQINLYYSLFVFEIFAAELLFLYSFEKKKFFVVKLIASFVICLLMSCLFDNLQPYIQKFFSIFANEQWTRSLSMFLRFIFLIGFSITSMIFCFKGKISTIISACAAGYAVEHFASKTAAIINIVFSINKLLGGGILGWYVSGIFYHTLIYVVAYFVFARKAAKNDYKNTSDSILNLLSVTIIFMGIGINRFASDFSENSNYQIVSNSLYAMLCCVFALIIQFNLQERAKYRREVETSERVLKEQAKQYNQWKISIEDINIKYHDMRHELQSLKEQMEDKDFTRMENMLNNYGAVVHTENEILDVLLTNKKMICDKNKIIFTCIVDGKALNNFDGLEMYALFCNALDNAMESLMTVSQEKRIMSLRVKQVGNVVSIHLQNYFEKKQINEKQSKKSKIETLHGYGLKSMQYTAEKYGGTIKTCVINNQFNLDILLPIP